MCVFSILMSGVLALAIVGQVFPSAFGRTLKVAVIDTGVDLEDERLSDVLCKDGHKDFTSLGLKDAHGHGTHVVGLIKKHAGPGNYCIIMYKYTHLGDYGRDIESLKAANLAGADFINLSISGPGDNYEEYIAIKSAIHRGATVVVAAGNEGIDHDSGALLDFTAFPADYRIPGVRVVGNLMQNGMRHPLSNFGSFVTDWVIGTDVVSTLPDGKMGEMTGTSQSAAIQTGLLIKRRLNHSQ